MAVGGFPGIMNRRRTVRAPINPMDKSTVVSIYPKHIKEVKPTIQPGVFVLEPGTYDNPFLLVVGSSSWWREVSEEEPLLEIPNGSIQVADAIVKDYCNGLVGCNMTSAMPGLFWIPGEHNIKDIQTKYRGKLEKAKTQQVNYYTALVRMADSLWARTNGNPLVITEDMRIAAKSLNLDMKDWMSDFRMAEKVACPACGTPIKFGVVVCSSCRAIVDPVKAKELGIHFAQ
jgi:hypothetical protein